MTSFPRGRRPREEALESKNTNKETKDHDNDNHDHHDGTKNNKKRKIMDSDFLFGHDKNNNNNNSTENNSSSKKKSSSYPESSVLLGGVPLGGGNVTHHSKKPKEGSGSGSGVGSGTATIEALSFKSFAKGTKLLGIVREVNDDFILVSLPSLLTGYILPKKQSDTIPLSHQLSVGQALTVYVAKLAAETVGKGNQQVKRIQLSVEPHHINSTWEQFSQHDVLRGRISSVEDHGVLVDLGNGAKGFCKFANVEGHYQTEMDEIQSSPDVRFLNEGRILDFIMEDKAKTSGAAAESRVVPLCLPKSLAHRITPSTYHPTLQALNPGLLVNCKVEAMARNGLLVCFSIFRGAIHVNQLGANWIPINKQGSDQEWKTLFSSVRNVTARIMAVDARTKVIRLSLQPHVLNLAIPPSLPPVGAIFPNATVIRVDPGIGALLSLPPYEEPIKGMTSALRKNASYCEAVQRPGVYVHISKAKTTSSNANKNDKKNDARMSESDFTKEYAPSTVHTVRILSTSHWMDGMATGATSPDIVHAHVLQHSDLIVGQIYRNVPVCGQLEGGSIMVDFGMGVRGLIPVIHLFDKSNMTLDYRNKLRKEKFAVGNKVDVRVLTVNTTTKRCVVTAKKSLVKAMDCIKEYRTVQVGQRATGYVSKLDGKALYVTFCNRVYGRVTAHSLAAELGVENHQSDYAVGDVVKCRVISCRRRVGRNFNSDADQDMDDVDEADVEKKGYWDLNLSLHVLEEGEATGDDVAIEAAMRNARLIHLRSGEILPAKSMQVIELVPSIDKKRGVGFIPGHAIVRIKSKFVAVDEDSGALPFVECKVPYDHILDTYETKDCESKDAMDEFARKHFTVGKKIDKPGMILSDPKKSSDEYASGIGKLPIISLRPQLIETVEKNAQTESEKNKILIPNATTSLFMGAYVQGFVHQSDPRHGAFVRFLDEVTGLVPNIKKGMNIKKWDTVTCKIVALDITCQPPKILLRRLSPGSINESSMEPMIKPGDIIESAQIIDLNFSRATVQIMDTRFPSDTKIRARLHVSLVDSPVMTTPSRRKGADKADDKETIGIVHPFYKWKEGEIIRELVCVSSQVSRGVTFVDLSNRRQIADEPSGFVKESSDLKPGMKVSGIVVGVAKSRRGIWLQPSPGVNCFVPALELSEDVDTLNELSLYFPAGARLECRVMDKAAWKKKQNWSVRAPKLKSDDESKSSSHTEVPFLSVLLNQSSTTQIEKPRKGQLIIGRINRSRRLYRPPSLMLELRGGYHGRCCITELEEVDEWVNMPIGRQQEQETTDDKDVVENIDDEVPPGDNVQSDDDESGGDENDRNTYAGFEDGEFVQCRVLESIPSDPVVEVSLRTSRLDGDLEDDELPQVGDAVNAYVVDTNKKGCFLRLSRNVEGRVILKELADGFLNHPEVSFPMGRLVVGKVKCIKEGKLKNKTRIDTTVDIDMRESELLKDEETLQYDDIKLNEKYKGIVSRVEDYGVFVKLENSEVSGLVHKSECSDSYVKSVNSLYDPGDLVKVLVIKKVDEGKKLALSMKASHFEGDTDSDDDSSIEDEDVEMENAEKDSHGEIEDADSDVDSEDENYVSKLASKIRADSNDDDVDDNSDQDDDNDDDIDIDEDSKNDEVNDTEALMETDVGFEWGPTPEERTNEIESYESGEDSEEDDEEGDAVGKHGHNSRKKAASRRREEEIVAKREKALADGTADENPETAGDFERLLASDPNNSECWIRFMAFYLSLADMEGCRRVAAHALERIDFRQEGERLNVWTALLAMELKFGGDFEATIEQACKQNNPKQVYLRACELLEKDSNNSDLANKMYEKMCKKFRSKKTVWVAYLSYLLKCGHHQEAHALLKRALLSLPSYKHIETMSKLAQLEFEYGSKERGRTVFDGILTKFPKRLDLLFVHVDKEVKAGEIASARSLLEKTAVCATKLSDKQMKKLFRKWMKVEEEHGDDDTQEHVKDVARAYVDRTTTGSSK